jgi:hypothetical protein
VRRRTRGRGRWFSRSGRALSVSTALALLCAGLGGCGQAAPSARTLSQSQRRALEGYLAQIEPVRLAVNRLLDAADPILSAYGSARSTAHLASLRMGALERRFASYAVDIAAIEPTTPELRSLHAIYAHTFVLEDSYSAHSQPDWPSAICTDFPTRRQNSERRSSSGAPD